MTTNNIGCGISCGTHLGTFDIGGSSFGLGTGSDCGIGVSIGLGRGSGFGIGAGSGVGAGFGVGVGVGAGFIFGSKFKLDGNHIPLQLPSHLSFFF